MKSLSKCKGCHFAVFNKEMKYCSYQRESVYVCVHRTTLSFSLYTWAVKPLKETWNDCMWAFFCKLHIITLLIIVSPLYSVSIGLWLLYEAYLETWTIKCFFFHFLLLSRKNERNEQPVGRVHRNTQKRWFIKRSDSKLPHEQGLKTVMNTKAKAYNQENNLISKLH